MSMTRCKECGMPVSTKAGACPTCGAKPDAKKNLSKTIGIVFLFIVVAVIFSKKDGQSNQVTGTSQVASPPVQDAPTFITTANELAAEYSKNTVSADNKFKDRRFRISGVVADINTDFTGSAVIVFYNSGSDFERPQATISSDEKQQASQLVKNERISLVCTGAGDVVKIPMLKDCVFN